LVVVSLTAFFALPRGAEAAKNEKHGNDKPAAQAKNAPGKNAPGKNAPGKNQAAGKGSEKASAEAKDNGSAKGAAQRAEHAEFKSKLAELRERRAQGQLSAADLKKELAALRSSRDERRREHREALRARWGSQLAQPAAQEELRHHEQRMARLERMALLAQNDPSGAKKDALVARIEKLTARENERHERKMAQLEASAQAAGAGETKSEKQAAAEPASEKADEKGSVR
jgi:hypothetical protein